MSGATRKSATSVGVLLLTLIFHFSSSAGPVTELYLTAGQQGFIYVVQGDNVQRRWQEINAEESGIAVLDTVQTTVGATGFPGHEYTIDGQYTGNAYTFPDVPGLAVYDGASDGRYIYSWDFNYNRVFRLDPDWSNPVALFSIESGVGDFIGITYDPSNQSLWISGWYKSELRNYSLDGTLLHSYHLAHNANCALALDPATDTLWLADNNVYGRFEQYSKTGTLLSVQTYPELATMNVLGAEFQVPEPQVFTLLALGFVVARTLRPVKARV